MAQDDPSHSGLLLGPKYMPPQHFSADRHFKLASSRVSSQLRSILEQGQSAFGTFLPNASSVSISMTSTAQKSPIFDFNFTGYNLNMSTPGAGEISRDTVFRIASISKLFTVYLFLLYDGFALWEKLVIDYVPELQRAVANSANSSVINTVRWDEVTLGSLASHMAGIARDYGDADLSTFPLPWTRLGFPKPPSASMPVCGPNEKERPCTRKEYFDGLIRRHPVFLTQSTPIYSNTAFRILSYVIEAIANDSFAKAMEQHVFRPLSLIHTSISKPADKFGAIIQEDSSWSDDLGDEAAGGGMYSSSHDLANFGRSILLSAQLSSSSTRRWLKPLTHTGSFILSIGSPWEIWRTKSDISSGPIIDLYTKSGGTGLYHSFLILIPDYQVTISIMTAGPQRNIVPSIAEIIIQNFIPVLHQSAKGETAKRLSGTYQSASGSNSLIVLAVDDGEGLRIQKWISNGADILASANMYAQSTNAGKVISVRLYPTDLTSEVGDGSRVAYRAVFDTEINGNGVTRVFDQDSDAWANVDQITYGNDAVDRFVFELNAKGTAVSIESSALGAKLLRCPIGECSESDRIKQ